jgi:endonuclease YncB( thermonuclease family)
MFKLFKMCAFPISDVKKNIVNNNAVNYVNNNDADKQNFAANTAINYANNNDADKQNFAANTVINYAEKIAVNNADNCVDKTLPPKLNPKFNANNVKAAAWETTNYTDNNVHIFVHNFADNNVDNFADNNVDNFADNNVDKNVDNSENYLKDGNDIGWKNTTEFTAPIIGGRVIKVYDADTITVASKLPYKGSLLYRFPVRLNGINAPEIKGKGISENEKTAAKNAQQFVSNLILNKFVKLENIKTEKYGRLLADVYINGVNLNQLLINEGYAIEYNGGTKNNPSSWLNHKNTMQTLKFI